MDRVSFGNGQPISINADFHAPLLSIMLDVVTGIAMKTDFAESRQSINGEASYTDKSITRSYRVQIAPRPIVIDETGLPVEDAVVVEIAFPGETIETATGPANIIVGAGIAKITVAGETIRGVPLC